MKDIIGKSKIRSKNLPGKLTINKVDVYNKPEISLEILIRNWPIKYQNYVKLLKHISIK